MSEKDVIDILNRMIPPELINGSDVTETAEMVELDIAYSPVVRRCTSEYNTVGAEVPTPDKVVKRSDGNYEIRQTDPPDFDIIKPEQLKVMRARYLLLRGFYGSNMKGFSYPVQQQIIHYYFPGGWFDMDALLSENNNES